LHRTASEVNSVQKNARVDTCIQVLLWTLIAAVLHQTASEVNSVQKNARVDICIQVLLWTLIAAVLHRTASEVNSVQKNARVDTCIQVLLLLLLLLFTAIGFSPGGSSPYTSTNNTNGHINIHKNNNTKETVHNYKTKYIQ
jgi:cytochrome b